MNDIINTINERRVVRKSKKDVVSKELLEQIIDAGRMAPSALNQQEVYIVSIQALSISDGLYLQGLR